jgi:hypothetical protein
MTSWARGRHKVDDVSGSRRMTALRARGRAGSTTSWAQGWHGVDSIAGSITVRGQWHHGLRDVAGSRRMVVLQTRGQRRLLATVRGQQRHELGDSACVVNDVISSGSGKMATRMEGSTGVGNDDAMA